MSKQKPKKMNLQEFNQTVSGGGDDVQLPEGPRDREEDDSNRWDKTSYRRDEPPRRDYGDREPRRDHGDREPRRGGFGDREPRREFGDRDREPRRDYGDRDDEPRRDRDRDEPSRADADSSWRRPGAGRSDRDAPREDAPRDNRADDSNDWRNSRQPRSSNSFGMNRDRRDYDRPSGDRFGDRPSGDRFGDRFGRYGDRPSGDRYGDRPSGDRYGDRPSGDRFGDRDRERSFGSSFGRRSSPPRNRSPPRGRSPPRNRSPPRDRSPPRRNRSPPRGRSPAHNESPRRSPRPASPAQRQQTSSPAPAQDKPTKPEPEPSSQSASKPVSEPATNGVPSAPGGPAADAPAADAPAPAPKVPKIKKLDPNVKLDPFGNARPKDTKDTTVPAKEKETPAPAKEASAAAAPAPSKGAYVPPSRLQRAAEEENRKQERSQQQGGSRRQRAVDLFNDEEMPPLPSQKPAAKPEPRANNAAANKTDVSELFPSKDDKKVQGNPLLAVLDQGGPLTPELLQHVGKLKLGLNDDQIRDKLATSFMASIEQNTASPKEIFEAFQTQQKFHAIRIFQYFLVHFKKLRGEEALVAMMKASTIDVNALSPLSGSLLCLKSSGWVGDEVVKMVDDSEPEDKIIAHIKSTVDEKSIGVAITTAVGKTVFRHVFVDKAKFQENVLKSYSRLLKLVAASVPQQIELLVQAHIAWNAVGSPKTVMLSTFKALLDLKIVAVNGFMAWREDQDSKKAAGKQQALVQTTSWLSELESKLNRNYYDDDDDDDLDDDDLNR